MCGGGFLPHPAPHTPPRTHPTPPQDPNAYENLIRTAEEFIAKRALAHIAVDDPKPVVHLIKYETDSGVWWVGLRWGGPLSVLDQWVGVTPPSPAPTPPARPLQTASRT